MARGFAAEKIRLHQQHECLWAERRLARHGIQPGGTGSGHGESFGRDGTIAAWRRHGVEFAATSEFPAVILRVAGIYGPGRGFWFRQFLRGEARIEGDGSRYLNMIHRDDVVGCIIAALKNGRPGEIYNAVDDEPVTQIEFFRVARDNARQAPAAAVSDDAGIVRKRGATNKRVSNAKLRTELKYEFQFPDFREGYAAEIDRRSADGSSA